MTSTPLLQATGLRRRYGNPHTGFEAVRGVDITVAPGELFALLGTNGAGKTSTMDLLQGVAAPTAGTVHIAGLDPYTHRRQLRPHMGIVLQNAGFSGDLTVAETTHMWAGTMAAPRPVDEALELVDIRGRSTVAVQSLSGGERRRLDLALAIMGRPSILFLDEPTTGLDVASRREFWSEIRGFLGGKRTVVLTTHYLEEADALADRVVVIDRGRVVVEGTPAEIKRRAAGRRVRAVTSLDLARISSLPGVAQAQRIGAATSILTSEAESVVRQLLQLDEHLTDLEVTGAGLEEAFLALTGNHQHPDQTSTTAQEARE